MIFIDNKYTRIYYAIINRAKTRLSNDYTEKHHIIPESFYIKRSRPGPAGWLEGNPEDSKNIVDLSAHEHYLCHYLLTKMLKGNAKYKMLNGFWMMCYPASGIQKDQRYRVPGRLYEILRKQINQDKKGKSPWNKGLTKSDPRIAKIAATLSLVTTGKESALKGRTSPLKGKSRPANVGLSISKSKKGVKLSESHKSSLRKPKNISQGTTTGKKSWTNGIINKFSVECPGSDFKIGSTKKGKPSKLKGVPRPAEVRDSISKSHIGIPGTVTGKIKWNNGKKIMYSITQPGPEWMVGGLAKGDKFAVQKGKRHWTNGIVSKMSFDCPGPDFVLGRIGWAKNL